MLAMIQVYMALHTASIKPTAGNKTRLSPSLFHVSTSSRLTMAGALWNEYLAACSTALRSATEKKESGCNHSVSIQSDTA